jgi:hypothetical protein
MIDDGDVYVRLMNLPSGIKGFVTESADMTYNVYINSRLSHEMQQETAKHELDHIKGNDFQSTQKLTEIE